MLSSYCFLLLSTHSLLVVINTVPTICAMATIGKKRNNACPTLEDYQSMADNPRCWHDFSVDTNALNIMRGYGYFAEEHTVETPDGFFLKMFRLPNHKSEHKRGVVFVLHGIYGSSADFLMKDNDSLVFLLNQEGYDVWSGNIRGNFYSNRHAYFTTHDNRYWNYSLDEISQIDLPLMLDYVSNQTRQAEKIVYLGYSLGSTVGLQYTSAQPKRALKTLKMMVLLAPAWKLTHFISPLKLLKPFKETIWDFVLQNGFLSGVSDSSTLQSIIKTVCLRTTMLENCFNLIALIAGPYNQFDPKKFIFLFNHFPAGISFKIVYHVSDLIFGKFTKYDFREGNMKRYGSTKPPEYNVTKIKVPVFVAAAKNDWISTLKDAKLLYTNLSPKVRRGLEILDERNFNHVDFLAGRDVKKLLYEKLVRVINGAFQESGKRNVKTVTPRS